MAPVECKEQEFPEEVRNVNVHKVLLAMVVLVCVVVVCGCGGGEDATPPSAETTSVTFAIEWPVTTTAILSALHRVDIRVTGPGIDGAVEASIERPETSTTFDVPSGEHRLFSLSGKNAEGAEIQSRQGTVEGLEANTHVELTFELYDPWDPTDDTSAGATAIQANGEPSGRHVLDRQATTNQDEADWFVFEAQAGAKYEIETIGVESTARHAVSAHNGDQALGVEDAEANQGVHLVCTAVTSGACYIKVWLPHDDGGVMAYCLRVSAPHHETEVTVIIR